MKNNGKSFLIGIILTTWLSFYSCYTSNKVSIRNIADLYQSSAHLLHPQFTLVHLNDSVSLLYFKIDESELLFKRQALADSFSAYVKIFCRVTSGYESSHILDSISTILNFHSSTNNKKKLAEGSIPLKLKRSKKYLVSINTSDLQSTRSEDYYLETDKTDLLGKQNFLIMDPSNGNLLFSNMFDSATSISIQYIHPVSKLFVRFYQNKFPIPAPPYITNKHDSLSLIAESSFSISPVNGRFLLTLKSKGMYHIMADSVNLEGLTIYRFDDSFPKISEAYEMIPPLQYITSGDEFRRLLSSKTPKQAVENFWLRTSSGKEDVAKVFIQRYYEAVQETNQYFTSYKDGWKTDRGMIYLMFGMPKYIHRSSADEVWTYGEFNITHPVIFTFLKSHNPFSNNDYVLKPDEEYYYRWRYAVSLWREGNDL
jgi:GWxTD domain-containing protein